MGEPSFFKSSLPFICSVGEFLDDKSIKVKFHRKGFRFLFFVFKPGKEMFKIAIDL